MALRRGRVGILRSYTDRHTKEDIMAWLPLELQLVYDSFTTGTHRKTLRDGSGRPLRRGLRRTTPPIAPIRPMCFRDLRRPGRSIGWTSSTICSAMPSGRLRRARPQAHPPAFWMWQRHWAMGNGDGDVVPRYQCVRDRLRHAAELSHHERARESGLAQYAQ